MDYWTAADQTSMVNDALMALPTWERRCVLMAYDEVVDSASLDSKLTQVADAIRTKGNTSAGLQFPSGFISAIQAIQTGTTQNCKSSCL
ncbi:MAG: hypothetical protein ACLR8L_00030 [Oscillospiraceae bacterium]